jgi:hypothetical protein
MTTPANGSHARQPPPASRVLITCTCLTHGGAAGFTNAALTKINGDIELDPHAVRACVLRFDEHGATTLRDTLTKWLG